MADQDGTIITISQQKGGAGKTTLAAHLAVALAGGKQKAAVLDTDPQGSLGEWFEARETRLGPDATGLTFRTSSGWGVGRETRSLAREHDYVIVDTPPKSDMEARPAIESCHVLLIPVQPTPVDIWATEATIEMAARAKVPAMFVLSRVPPRAGLTAEMEKLLKAFDVPCAKARLGNRVAFAGVMGTGSTIQEHKPTSKGAQEVAALAKEIRAYARKSRA